MGTRSRESRIGAEIAPASFRNLEAFQRIEKHIKDRENGNLSHISGEIDIPAGLESVNQSESLQVQILKGINEGLSVEKLLIKALECISEITGNSYYKTSAREKFIEIYGHGLQNREVLEIELRETEERLEKLHMAEKSRNIDIAIIEHEKKAQELRNKIEKIINIYG